MYQTFDERLRWSYSTESFSHTSYLFESAKCSSERSQSNVRKNLWIGKKKEKKMERKGKENETGICTYTELFKRRWCG
jgi:hypothetical protein